MNPKAKPFVFSAAANEWKPPAPPAAAAPPSPPKEEPEAAVEEPEAVEAEEDAAEDEDIDENDPLWKATLELANGDRKAALKLLEDPDSLMRDPKIIAIMDKLEAVDAAAGDDWESNADKSDKKSAAEEPAKKISAETVSAPSQSEKIAAAAAGDDDEGVGDDDGALVEGDPREHLNVVFIGHVDAGKSTLSGSILYIMGRVDQRTIERYEREAKQRNRESWFLAFIMDTSEEERAKGKTVEVGRAHFETEKNRYTILDAPGHKNYVPNMIAGCCQADVGVLVISARKGEFETGFEKGGQTREHALLAKTLGVQYLVVVINKMDDPTVNWDKERYEECVSKLKPFLKQCGYTIKTTVKFVPISALSGDNILKEVSQEKCPWWKEYHTTGNHNTTTPTLLSTFDSLVLTGRNAEAPLRIPVLDRYFERGCVVMGKVESGTLRMGEEIVFAPTRKSVKVEAIYIDENKVPAAKPGENVLVKFQCNVEDVQKGYVLCNPGSICHSVTVVKVQLALVDMLEHRPIFSPGYDAVMHVHTVEIEVTCSALVSVLDAKGQHIRRPFARQGQMCIAMLTLPLNTCIETFSTLPALGRFTLRDEGRTIAIGKIMELSK